MAICKIIPIKQSSGIRDCLDYISDEEKVISSTKSSNPSPQSLNPSQMDDMEEEQIVAPMDFHSVLAYMENSEKTHRTDEVHKKYISGYMCSPETADREFMRRKKENLSKQGKTIAQETGNWAYHIIQSFPENLDISDDEVHQCGRELCEKLGVYQAVICSHVHPVIDEEGEVTGKCKHNHILINSHIHPDKLDPAKPNVYKYHDCKETYAQLQQWNDEISLEHGLPIIRNPELNRKYSWFKNKMEKEGSSWQQQVARDIKNTMRFCSNWEQFKEQMTEQGYFIREAGKTITYYTPEHTEDNQQKIREKRLGKEYTKAELERYWKTIGKAKDESSFKKGNPSNVRLIRDLIKQYDTNLFIEVTIKNKRKPYTLDIPLKNPRRQISEATINTYIEREKTYNLCTADHVPLLEVTGQDIFEYYEQLRKEREKRQKKNSFYADEEEYYYDATKFNFKTNRPYRIRLWDENGRRRTTIELMCILAITIIKNEHATTDSPPAFAYKGTDGKYIYAKTDWKLQNMYNAMSMAREMNVENSNDVSKRLDRTGKEVAQLRKQTRHLTEQHNQMSTIHENLEAMEAVKEICEQIYNMPDGEEKEAAMAAHAAELAQYKTAKRYLHMKNISTEDEIADFKQRYQSTTAHFEEIRQRFDEVNQEYRNLKKIEYNMSMAQNNYYCYGPGHEMFANERAAEETTQEQENKQIN